MILLGFALAWEPCWSMEACGYSASLCRLRCLRRPSWESRLPPPLSAPNCICWNREKPRPCSSGHSSALGQAPSGARGRHEGFRCRPRRRRASHLRAARPWLRSGRGKGDPGRTQVRLGSCEARDDRGTVDNPQDYPGGDQYEDEAGAQDDQGSVFAVPEAWLAFW